MSRSHGSTQQEVKYVYDLPYTVRKQLCNILDANNEWERLGGTHMGFKWCDLQEFRRAERCGESPTDRLLQSWGQQNHTVKELFYFLYKIEHFQAMRVLQSCVPEKYHKLVKANNLRLTEMFLEKPVKGGVVVNLQESTPMTTGPHTVPTDPTSPATHHHHHNTTPFTPESPTLTSRISVEKPSQLNQTTSSYLNSNYSMEGACALDPSHYHNLQTPDEKHSSLNRCSSSKVPISLLCPALNTNTHINTTSASIHHNQPPFQPSQKVSMPPHFSVDPVPKKPDVSITAATATATGAGVSKEILGPQPTQSTPVRLPTAANPKNAYRFPTAALPKEGLRPHLPVSTQPETIYRMPTAANPDKPVFRIPSAANPNKAPQFFSNGPIESKINNNENNGPVPEVSCEDNNQDDLKTKSTKTPYDPDQDYLQMVERKRAKEAARERQFKAASEGSNSASSNSLTVAQAAQGVTPETPPSQQHQQTSSRKISNVPGAECPYSSVPVIPYKELEEATALWSQHNLLGRGGFGAVYKGTWKNTEVAIKRIEPHGNAHLDNTRLHITQSLDELKLLQSYRHDNILQVYGYSTDHELYPCLVYQFMPRGSVEDRLQCRRIEAFGESNGHRRPEVLGWRQRFRVALGTAAALQFLHTVKEKPLIHGDVKSANILLDQNYEPKLGDFGLAKEGKSCSTSLQMSRVHGTKPYLPVEYLRSKRLNVKVDTYSFGIVLFELCTGLRGYDDKRKEGQKFLWELVEESEEEALRDKKPAVTREPEVFPFLLELGKTCAQQRASRRPDMTKVFKDLESFKIVMEERARARRISMGESSSACSTPHLLQVRYDTAGSLNYPSTVPSFPYYFHHPSSSGVSTIPPPSSTGVPRSPIPPGTPHYYPHPLVRGPYPGMVMNGQVGYHPRPHPPGSPSVWMQDPMLYGAAAHHPSNPQRYFVPNHNLSPGAGIPPEQDPPSYSETISQPPPGAMGGTSIPIIPQLSSLNLNSDSESDYSDMSDTKSSLARPSMQSAMPTVLPEMQTSGDIDHRPCLPLLTILNNTVDSS